MAKHPHQDLYNLRGPGIRISYVDSATIKRCLLYLLRYACQYWVHYVQKAEDMLINWDDILAFLHEHLFHWLEELSFLKQVLEAVCMLRCFELLTVSIHLRSCVILTNVLYQDDEVHHDLYKFMCNAMKFVRSNMVIKVQAPLQVYCSALLLAQPTS